MSSDRLERQIAFLVEADKLKTIVRKAARLRELWEEFEAHETIEARFANALDRLQALLQNMGAVSACGGRG